MEEERRRVKEELRCMGGGGILWCSAAGSPSVARCPIGRGPRARGVKKLLHAARGPAVRKPEEVTRRIRSNAPW